MADESKALGKHRYALRLEEVRIRGLEPRAIKRGVHAAFFWAGEELCTTSLPVAGKYEPLSVPLRYSGLRLFRYSRGSSLCSGSVSAKAQGPGNLLRLPLTFSTELFVPEDTDVQDWLSAHALEFRL